jgi:hypothetical protein
VLATIQSFHGVDVHIPCIAHRRICAVTSFTNKASCILISKNLESMHCTYAYTSDMSLAKVQHLALPPSRWHGSPMSPGRDPDLKPAHCQSYSLYQL